MPLKICQYLQLITLLIVLNKISADYGGNPFFNDKIKFESTRSSNISKNNVNSIMLSDNPFFQKISNSQLHFGKAETTVDINKSRNPFFKEVYSTTTSTKTTTTTTTRPRTKNTEQRLPSNPSDININERKTNSSQIINDICGRSIIRSLAIGGETIRNGEHPWIVALWHMDKRRYLHFKCGGSIISDKHVVTGEY